MFFCPSFILWDILFTIRPVDIDDSIKSNQLLEGTQCASPTYQIMWDLSKFPLIRFFRLAPPMERIHRNYKFNHKVQWLSDSLPISEETLDTRVLNIMHCWLEMARRARVLQYWLIRTYKEGWSSYHISILQWSHVYQGLPTYLESSSSNYYWTWDIVPTVISDCFLCGPQMTFEKQSTQQGLPKDQLLTCLKFTQLSLLEITCSQCWWHHMPFDLHGKQ